MELQQLNQKLSTSRPDQIKAIFANIMILQNKLQTMFDHANSAIT